jgi:hypothetical protein
VVASVLNLRGDELWARVRDHADDLGDTGYDTRFGHGRLNSYRAVTGETLDDGTSPPPSAPLAAAFTYSCSGPTCASDGSSSTGKIDTYTWTFGSPPSITKEKDPTITYTFGGVGDYSVELVVDDGSTTDSTTRTITCTQQNKNKIRCS